MDIKSFIEDYEKGFWPIDDFSHGLFTAAAFIEGFASGAGGNNKMTEIAEFLKTVGHFSRELQKETRK